MRPNRNVSRTPRSMAPTCILHEGTYRPVTRDRSIYHMQLPKMSFDGNIFDLTAVRVVEWYFPFF